MWRPHPDCSPACEVIGLDPDAESIRQVRRAAQEAGLGERIPCVAETIATYRDSAGFDLLAACHCTHDFAPPARTPPGTRPPPPPAGTPPLP